MPNWDNQRPSLKEWLEAYPKLEYNEYWHQYEALCPVCGDNGLLEVPNKINKPPVIWCSNCKPSNENTNAYWAIREAVGLHEKPGEKPHEMELPKGQKKVQDCISLWESSVPLDGTPAETYLVRRLAIPPQPDLIPRPVNLAWLDRQKALFNLPDECFGALIAKYEQGAEISGLEFEGLLSDGRRPDWEGFKRCKGTLGDKKSGVFHASGQKVDQKRLAVCENYLSAIALSMLEPDLQAIALGGTSACSSIPIELLTKIALIETIGEEEGSFANSHGELLKRMGEYKLREPKIKTHKPPINNAMDELANLILEGVMERFLQEVDGCKEWKLARKLGLRPEFCEHLGSQSDQWAKRSFLKGFLPAQILQVEDLAPWNPMIAAVWQDVI